jgi:hypothetical protein
MDRLEIDNILKIDDLNSELEFERATSIHGKLRWMVKEDSSLEPVRHHLLALIERYESEHWNNESGITDTQMTESDLAERIVGAEALFVQKRKQLILAKLKENEITQMDFAKLLGHRPHHLSELMNGVRQFSRDDIIVIHRLFEIDFNDLIPPFLKMEIANHIKATLGTLKNSRISLKIKDLETV